MITLAVDPVLAVAVVQIVLVVVVLVTIAAQGRAQSRRRRRRQEVLLHLARHAFDKGKAPDPDVLRKLSPSDRARLLAALAAEVSGRDLVTVAGLAERNGVISLSTRWCRSRRWRRRLVGAQIRTAFVNPDPLTADLLEDAHPQVRAEAARAAARHPDAALCRRLVSMLDDPSAICRMASTEALMGSGVAGVTAVIEGLSDGNAFGPAANVRIRALLRIAAQHTDPALVTAAMPFTTHVVPSVRAAAITTVGALGRQGSGRRAAAMLSDVDPRVRVAAAAALGALAAPLEARLLVPGLSDPVWDVREASGLALDQLGAMGRTYLRLAARRDGGPAADMARRILDLPVPHGDEHHDTPSPGVRGVAA